MEKKITDRVFAVLHDLSGTSQIDETDSLLLDLGLDSLGMVTLLMQLEETFQIELKESDLNPFDLIYVSDVVQLIQQYLGEDK